jgi:hypothetical protein
MVAVNDEALTKPAPPLCRVWDLASGISAGNGSARQLVRKAKKQIEIGC